MTEDSGTCGQVGRHGPAAVNGPQGEILDWHPVY